MQLASLPPQLAAELVLEMQKEQLSQGGGVGGGAGGVPGGGNLAPGPCGSSDQASALSPAPGGSGKARPSVASTATAGRDGGGEELGPAVQQQQQRQQEEEAVRKVDRSYFGSYDRFKIHRDMLGDKVTDGTPRSTNVGS